MNTSMTRAGKSRRASRILIALVCGSLIGAMPASPAFARDNDRRDVHRDDHHDRNERGYRRPYYAAPVYAPAPVYYPPQQSPGISLFLPLNIHIR
jgi:hypothetical protein